MRRPTCEQALQRLRSIYRGIDYPLSKEERDYVVARCIDGGPIFLRCIYEQAYYGTSSPRKVNIGNHQPKEQP